MTSGEREILRKEDSPYREAFNATITETIGKAVRIIGQDPALIIPGTLILHNQKKAASVRRQHERNGLIVPPVMIASITSRCNLACAGCYMHGRKEKPAEMSKETLASVVHQAAGLGVSIIVIAGGEPLVRQEEIFRIAEAYPRVLFPLFTNGLLIDDATADAIAACRNIVPVISFEGFREETDSRRGHGVFDRLLAVARMLKARGVFFGCSVTTTRENFSRVTGQAFVQEMLDTGARVFTYVEYVPMQHGSEKLVLTREQKKTLQLVLVDYNRKYPALFIGFPGDEEAYGGCLAAGRGFVHVSPSGDLEPCPAAPYSDANLAAVSLEEALRSRLLARLRSTPEVLRETEGGCALRANRPWAEELAGRQ